MIKRVLSRRKDRERKKDQEKQEEGSLSDIKNRLVIILVYYNYTSPIHIP